jgi:amino acid adenylation domain-containing protein
MSSQSSLAGAAFRISYQQERAWLEQERGLANFAQCVISVDGRLDRARLEQAVRTVIARYEILRTVLRRQSGVKLPFQIIKDEMPFSLAQAAAGVGLSELLRQERAELAASSQERVWRATLVPIADERQLLMLSLPAFCADSTTLKNLGHEMASALAGRDCGEVMQYADLVEWQNELLASEEAKVGRDFWRENCRSIDLAGLESLTLPLEKKTESPFEFASFEHPDRKLAAALEPLAQELNSSLETLLLAAWNVLLARVLSNPAVVVGCEFDGRRYEELRSTFGPLARVLPLQIEVGGQHSFREIVEKIGRAHADARNWQESFAWNRVNETAHAFLPFAFSYIDAGSNERTNGPQFTVERVLVVSEPFKLRLNALLRQQELILEFHYDRSKLAPSAVTRLAGYYHNLLAAAVEKPQTPISRLPLLSPTERRQLLIDWNQTQASHAADKCLHQLFEDQASRTPERLAVRCGEETLTYRDLNQRANQLAHFLARQGVGPDSAVGLCLERSTAMMVALLGILKAGGAYVPLNADSPRARMEEQLKRASALVTESKLLAHLPEFAGPLLVLERDQLLLVEESSANPEPRATPENLAYVIYTSGSTGVPKGVAVRHRNLVNYADFITKKLGLRDYPQGLEFATVSTLAADLGNTCIYPALISGGGVHVIPHEASTDPLRFGQYLSQYPLDVLKIVPSHLQALLEGEQTARLLPREFLIMGGEALTPKLVKQIESLRPTCQIMNHYGPTETTIGSLTLSLKDYDWRNSPLKTIPIGRPIQNTQVYVLDAHLEPVPIGVPGELYISGAGVSAGYLGDPQKTAERFVTNPFSQHPDSNMYRSGDVVRYGEDGAIEFLGRSDDQIKIRGFRVELGEIEAILARHAAVKQAVVVAKEDAQGEKRLVAYVVSDGAAEAGETLRRYLKQELPDYMVPQAIVPMAKLPLNANGKIDRKLLPEPEQVSKARTYVVPRTACETAMVDVWAEVLHLDKGKISVDDNFFDLGGHSLLATQVVSRLRRALNIELPLRMLFEFPTVAGFARQADAIFAASAAQPPAIRSVPRNQPLPLSFAQQRLWVLDQIEPNNSLYNVPRAIRLRGKLNATALLDSLNEIVRRHEALRTTFAKAKDGTPVQVCRDSLILHVPILDMSSRPASERESGARAVAAEEARTPFDLAQGPLLRARLLRLDNEDHVLLLTMHHIVSDAWSAGVFFQELGTLYSAYLEGKPSPLPELPIQYADYAVWQRNWLQGKVLEEQLSYWREHLRGAPPLLELPSDRPRPEVRRFAGAYERILLSREIASRVQVFSQQQGVTAFMTMLGAFKALLARYSGQEHIVLGTDIANRTTSETERLIGFFINLLPLHTDLSGDPSFRELVLRVREVALGAYAHQDIPFDKLVEDLQPERKLSHNPIVQALFVMQNIPSSGRQMAGLELEAFAAPLTHSKFDLAVFMQYTGAETFAHWVYSTELFERETILRMASHFETLLGHAILQSDSRLSQLEIYSPEEKQQREQEKKQRKQSQRKKLMAIQPKSMQLAQGDEEG